MPSTGPGTQRAPSLGAVSRSPSEDAAEAAGAMTTGGAAPSPRSLRGRGGPDPAPQPGNAGTAARTARRSRMRTDIQATE